MFGGGYPVWKVPLYKSFALSNQKSHLIRADSHGQLTLERVKSILNGKEIDFLFIDGDHTYEGVKKDFKMYSPLVKNGGVIAFHDIVPGPKGNVGGVPEFWQEIKSEYKYLEIVKDGNQGGCGIGLVYKNHRGYQSKDKSLTQKVTYYLSKYAFQLLCVKDVSKNSYRQHPINMISQED
jgi:hypothetical protein